ncbi:MAG: 7-cyano-7-deazaguanine synthase, partial [Cyanobacteria bacterium]|nr:7-cyano-7-deazaguanine synthase [Cyanobacteriota bacterium]
VCGVSQEDYSGYPDCRESFIQNMEKALIAGLDRTIRIVCPLMFLTKCETVQLAMSIPGCMEALSYSTTCYNGTIPPCNRCNSCLLRAKGFSQASVEDPLLERLCRVSAEGVRP